MTSETGCYRDLRVLETAPDAYVRFEQRQRQWSFSYRHPLLWNASVVLAIISGVVTLSRVTTSS